MNLYYFCYKDWQYRIFLMINLEKEAELLEAQIPYFAVKQTDWTVWLTMGMNIESE